MFIHLALDGIADGPLGVALDVVHTAARLAGARQPASPRVPRALRQRVVSLDGAPVRTGAGRVLQVDGPLSLRGLGKDDALVVAGLGAASEAQIAAVLERADVRRAVDALTRAAARGVLLGASCSSTFLLAAAGALDRRRATTTWWLRASFVRRFPQVTLCDERMVVESGRVFSAGAALAHADMMLAIVARTVSPALAHLVARYLLIDDRTSQARYMLMEHVRTADPTVEALESFVHANLARQVSLVEMARATGTSPRTLARKLHAALGTTPQRFAQRLRMARAGLLLETTRASVEEVAARVGYADAAAFRRIFRRFTGESPSGRRAPS